MRYAVIIEQGDNNYSAYVPDLPGCVSVGDTLNEVKAEIREAIAFHLDGMREDGLPIPPPTSLTAYVEIVAPEQSYDGAGARSRDSKASASTHLGKELRPHATGPRSGLYEQVGPRGGQSGSQAAWPREAPLPPTPKQGAGWEVVRPAQGAKSSSSSPPKRGRRKEV